mgnify:CR=1 FL=1
MENSLNDILIIIFYLRYFNQTFTNAGQTKKLTKNELEILADQKEPFYNSFENAHEMDDICDTTPKNNTISEWGVKCEYALLDIHFGIRGTHWEFVKQKMLTHEAKRYDIITIKLLDDSLIDIYFDITSWFGKN